MKHYSQTLLRPTLKPAYMITVYVVALLLSLCHVNSFAQGKQATNEASYANTYTSTQTSTVQDTVIQQATKKGSEWGLKADEWQRYEELMKGRLGLYSPGIDPLTALGIEARNDQERKYYAELQVQAEAARVERELAYQKAYDEAFKRLFPELMPLMGLSDMGTGVSSNAGLPGAVSADHSRLAVFVQNDCLPCEQIVQQLQRAGTAFDLYMVGSGGNDAVIRRWATKAGIDPQKVLSRTITLNHDAGKWDAMSLNGALPAVVREVGGKWQRQ